MTFTLHVDGPTWREHLAEVMTAVPGLVPVAKGNGYGFGNARLAAEAARVGAPVLAVGTSVDLGGPARRRRRPPRAHAVAPGHRPGGTGPRPQGHPHHRVRRGP